MRTVKEVSGLTGISVRTLHWYDEVGLLKPTATSEAGYRLYDDKALETLQQILFFREFDIPLKDIKSIMENPGFDRQEILRSQKRMLELKRDRLERLIASIEDILKGENRMDFEIFSQTEIQELYQAIVKNMSEEQLEEITGQYGGLEAYEKHFMESAGSPKAQANYAKILEWYGDKESLKAAAMNPRNPEIMQAYQRRLDAVLKRLAAKKGTDVHSFEVKEIVGEYDFVSRQLWQMKDVTAMMLEMAAMYQNDAAVQKATDGVYGAGGTAYIGQALEAFYRR